MELYPLKGVKLRSEKNMDPVQDKPLNSQDPSSSLPPASDAPAKIADRPTPKRPVPPPLPDLEDDLVKPGSVAADEPPKPEPVRPHVPREDPQIQSNLKVAPPPPPPPPPSEESAEETLKPATPPPSSSLDTKSKVLLAAGPLFLVASLGISAFIVNSRPAQPTQYPVEQGQPANPALEEASNFDEGRLKYILENSPVNPTEATVTCQSTGETLESGQPTSCPDPVFTWSGEYSKEPGTEIIGYYVYFGTNGNDSPISLESKLHDVRDVIQPFRDGVHQSENTYTPTNLQSGTTYYLAVSAESSTQNGDIRLGLDPVSIDPPVASSAKILFTYVYE